MPNWLHDLLQAAGIHYDCHDSLAAAQPDNFTAAATISKPLLDPSKNLASLANIQPNLNIIESKIDLLVSGQLDHLVKPDATSNSTTFRKRDG